MPRILEFQGFPGLDIKEGIFRAWWMEPLVASVSFAAAVHFYWYQERKRGLSREGSFMDVMMKNGDGAFVRGDLTNSLLAYWVGIMSLRIVVPQQQLPDGIPVNLNDVIYFIGEVVSGVILYDAIFFVLHWLMHNVRYLQRFHRRHHHTPPQRTVEARDVLRHSMVDGTLQVLCNILVQQRNHMGQLKSRLARVVHNVVVTWMLTESHTASPDPNIFRRWFSGVRDHRSHHLGTMRKHHRESYQQFFGYLDSALEAVRRW